jgi:peptidoglycan/xylan/chitin deacetylase (PgdA/CDA1 family)
MDKFLVGLLQFKTLNRYIHQFLGHHVAIFMIHRASSKDGSYQGLSPELLEQCLIYAKNHHYEFASIDEIVSNANNGVTPKKPTLCFTLDDGFSDQVDELVPILLKHNAKPTIFVLADFLDNVDWPWDYKIAYMINHSSSLSTGFIYKGKPLALDLSSAQGKIASKRTLIKHAKYYVPGQELADFMAVIVQELAVSPPAAAPENYKPTCWEKLRHYEKQGLNVGSHARTHRVFSSLPIGDIRQELVHAKNRLNAELAAPSLTFCYPSGTEKDYFQAHAELVRELGYTAAVSANPGNTSLTAIKQNPYHITRYGFPNTLARFARYSSWLEVLRDKFN